MIKDLEEHIPATDVNKRRIFNSYDTTKETMSKNHGHTFGKEKIAS